MTSASAPDRALGPPISLDGDDDDPAAGVTAALFAPIDSPTAFERTVERLGSAVRLGILPPGSRLPPERALAERFEISRGTLRQALTALIQSGLLVARRGRTGGTWVVAEWPPVPAADDPLRGDWSNAIDARLAVESGGVLLAARRATADQLDALQGLHDELATLIAEDAPFQQHRRTDIRFHFVLAEASGSSEYRTRMPQVQHAMTELIGRGPRPKVVLERSNEQHQEIIDALRRQDGGAAAVVIYEHIEGTRLVLEGLGSQRDEP